jgi:hypothetical protein
MPAWKRLAHKLSSEMYAIEIFVSGEVAGKLCDFGKSASAAIPAALDDCGDAASNAAANQVDRTDQILYTKRSDLLHFSRISQY